MNLDELLKKKILFEQEKGKIDSVSLSSYEKDFELTYTHNSTALEGNTLTLMETKLVLEDGISVGGKELREIMEKEGIKSGCVCGVDTCGVCTDSPFY